MERKKFKGILSCLFGGRQKVKVSKFAFDVFIFVVSSAAHSVGTTLNFEVFRSGPDPEYSRVSAFWFFSVYNHGFCGGPNTFSQKNTRLFSRANCDQ